MDTQETTAHKGEHKHDKKHEAAAEVEAQPEAEKAPEVAETEKEPEAAAAPVAEVKTKSPFELLMAACQDNTEEGKKKFRIQAVNETDHNFFQRLVDKALTIPDPIFDALPEDIQKWACAIGEAAVAAQEKNEDLSVNVLTAPPGFVSRYQVKEGAVVKPPKEPKAAKVPKEKKVLEKKERVRDENTLGRIIRRALINDQSVGNDKLLELLSAAGHKDVKVTSISSYRTDTLETLRLAADMGMFKPKT